MVRHVLVLLAALAVAAPVSSAASPTLYFDYRTDCTFTVSVDGGGSTANVPPGVYQIYVGTTVPFADDPPPGCPYPRFHLTGPGVDVSTDLSSGGETAAQFTATLSPGATYVAQDMSQPSASRRTIGVAATGSSSSLAPPPGSSTSSAQGSSDTNGSQGVVGSTVLRGSLAGTVGASGAVRLTGGGKPVTTLRSGRYVLVVDDRSPRRGFALEALHGRPVAVTSAGFVGTKRLVLTLQRGQWTYFAPGGRKTSFLVAG